MDGWRALPHHTHSHLPPGSQNAPTLPTADPGTLCHRQIAKASPKHNQNTSTPLQYSKTKLTLKSKLLPSIPRTFCFLFSSDTSNFCMMSRQYSGVTLFICTKTTVEVHLFLMSPACENLLNLEETNKSESSHQLKPMSF